MTVLMPAFNAAKYIADAIQSVLAQTFTDFELLIIDDGSTDNTISVIRKFTDSRIRLVRCEHKGVAQTLNSGLAEAQSDLIANPDYILIGAEEDYIDMNGEYLFTLKHQAYSDAEIRQLNQIVCPFSHVTVMYKKCEVIAAGGYDSRAHNFEDHLLWLKLISRGKVCNLSQPLVKYRFNPESVTIDEKWRGGRFGD
ncbi:MAG: glycosyltransferase [Chitinophagaceae bacterium]